MPEFAPPSAGQLRATVRMLARRFREIAATRPVQRKVDDFACGTQRAQLAETLLIPHPETWFFCKQNVDRFVDLYSEPEYLRAAAFLELRALEELVNNLLLKVPVYRVFRKRRLYGMLKSIAEVMPTALSREWDDLSLEGALALIDGIMKAREEDDLRADCWGADAARHLSDPEAISDVFCAILDQRPSARESRLRFLRHHWRHLGLEIPPGSRSELDEKRREVMLSFRTGSKTVTLSAEAAFELGCIYQLSIKQLRWPDFPLCKLGEREWLIEGVEDLVSAFPEDEKLARLYSVIEDEERRFRSNAALPRKCAE